MKHELAGEMSSFSGRGRLIKSIEFNDCENFELVFGEFRVNLTHINITRETDENSSGEKVCVPRRKKKKKSI
jgi:hypothetical protein